jgi:hypothetical protein
MKPNHNPQNEISMNYTLEFKTFAPGKDYVKK